MEGCRRKKSCLSYSRALDPLAFPLTSGETPAAEVLSRLLQNFLVPPVFLRSQGKKICTLSNDVFMVFTAFKSTAHLPAKPMALSKHCSDLAHASILLLLNSSPSDRV